MTARETIVSHHVRKYTKEISLKIHYPENHVKHLVKLENLCLDEPWICIQYAAQNNLIEKPGWE